MARLKRGQISADAFRKAYEYLKVHQRPKEYCPKCGKEVINMPMHPDAVEDMAAAGYDGTCCWPGFDEIAKRMSKP